MFTKSARFYDAQYSFKDYAAESAMLHELIQRETGGKARTLLDVACGTGAHDAHLKAHYAVEGVDLDPQMVALAKERNLELDYHLGDMSDFNLGKTFDAVLCLFSSIGYVGTVERLNSALSAFARHTSPGGVVIVEPWLLPEVYIEGPLHALFVDQPDLKIARMNRSVQQGRMAVVDFHFLVGSPEGFETFEERHELFLFSHEEYLAAFRGAGLDVRRDEGGPMGRGLYVGKPTS